MARRFRTRKGPPPQHNKELQERIEKYYRNKPPITVKVKEDEPEAGTNRELESRLADELSAEEE